MEATNPTEYLHDQLRKGRYILREVQREPDKFTLEEKVNILLTELLTISTVLHSEANQLSYLEDVLRIKKILP